MILTISLETTRTFSWSLLCRINKVLAKEIVWDNIWQRMNTFRHDFIKFFPCLKFDRILPTERSCEKYKIKSKVRCACIVKFSVDKN